MRKFVKLCKINDVSEKSPKVFVVEGRKVGVYFNGKEYFAFSPTCPHANANLRLGRYTESTVICRWHNWEFDLKSGKGVNNEGKLKKFLVKIEQDDILVRFEENTDMPDEIFPEINWKS